MVASLIQRTRQEVAKSGINYVCGGCGSLLFHTGVEGAIEGGQEAFPVKQPAEVVERLRSCPNCGRMLNAMPNPDAIKVKAGLVRRNRQ